MSDVHDLDLGPGLVQRLLPQRPPFLMVDRILSWRPGERAQVRAARYLSMNEPVFQGHFPGLPLFPGALLVEGGGQTASLVYTLGAILDGYRERGRTLEEMVGDLKNLDRAYTMHPGYRASPEAPIQEAFGRLDGMPVGVAGAVRFKFLKPVTPGCVLTIQATLTRHLGEQLHFDIEASTERDLVARGSLSAAVVSGATIPT